MGKKANKILAIIFLIFAIGVLAVGITWSSDVKSSMNDTEIRLHEIQQSINTATDSSAISYNIDNYNQNVRVYNSYLDMYDIGFKLIMTLIIADLVVVIILIAIDKPDDKTKGVKESRKVRSEQSIKDLVSEISVDETNADGDSLKTPGEDTSSQTSEGNSNSKNEVVSQNSANINVGGQSTIELTKQLRKYKNMLAAGELTEAEFSSKKEELLGHL